MVYAIICKETCDQVRIMAVPGSAKIFGTLKGYCRNIVVHNESSWLLLSSGGIKYTAHQIYDVLGIFGYTITTPRDTIIRSN